MNFSPELLPNRITNAKIKNKKMNKELSAGTTDEQRTKANNQHLSPACIKPNVIGSLFKWNYRYVKEGQLEPDKFGRWAIDCYMYVHIEKALPKYKWVKEMLGKAYMPVRVATMFQKGSVVGSVPSSVHKFCVTCPSFEDAGNTGFATQRNFYSNDIEELKRIVEEQFNNLRTVFRYCR